MRQLDHLVLPVKSLQTSRQRYEQLGFTVAAVGVHPFGTANCCVFFADDTYLEPLALIDEALARAASDAGNHFIRFDQAFRQKLGDEGFSALVIKSDDAMRDHQHFLDMNLSAAEPLSFRRPFKAPDGSEQMAGFQLAFAAEPRAPDVLFFACERLNALSPDRSALCQHRNGASSIARIFMIAADPEEFRAFLSPILDVSAREIAGGLSFDLNPLSIEVHAMASNPLKPSSLKPRLALEFSGIEFAVANLAATADYFDQAGIEIKRLGESLKIAPAQGQGTDFLFREKRI